jgi:hypothetical protein
LLYVAKEATVAERSVDVYFICRCNVDLRELFTMVC